MKGKENSMPLKKRMNRKWVEFKIQWEFVRFCFLGVEGSFDIFPFDVEAAREEGSVSGRQKYR